MIADDRRRSRIADDRKESCFHIIADDRKRSQSRLQPYISVSRNVKWTRALCSRQILANNMADYEEEILLQANLLLLLVLKRRHRQLQKRRKHRFWVRKIFMKRQKLGAFHTLQRELRDRTITNINEHSGSVAKKRWIIWVRIEIIMGYVSIVDRRTLVSIWSQDRKRSQTIADDRKRSQKICDSRSSAIVWKPALNSGSDHALDPSIDNGPWFTVKIQKKVRCWKEMVP